MGNSPPQGQPKADPSPLTANLDAAGFDLTNFGSISSSTTPVADAGAIRLGHAVDNSQAILWRNAGDDGNRGIISGTNTLFFGPGWSSVIFDTFTTVDMSGSAVNAGSIQIDNFGAIDLDNGDINSVGFIEMLLGGQLLLGGTSTQTLEADAGGMIFGLPAADTYDFQIASTSEYEFSATQADWKGNNLINLAVLESNAAIPSTAGAIRLGDTEQILWRNNGNNANLGIDINNDIFNFVNVGIITASSMVTLNAQSAVGNFDAINVTSGIDYGSGDLTSVNVIELDPSGSILFNGVSTQSIQGVAAGFIFSLPTGDSYDYQINSTSEYEFNATQADFNDNNIIDLGDVTFNDASNVILNTTTGTKIGTATTQKLGFWNATPVAQQSGTGETTGFTAGAGTAVNDDSTFTGNVGSTAYRISDIVKALKNTGILAS